MWRQLAKAIPPQREEAAAAAEAEQQVKHKKKQQQQQQQVENNPNNVVYKTQIAVTEMIIMRWDDHYDHNDYVDHSCVGNGIRTQ